MDIASKISELHIAGLSDYDGYKKLEEEGLAPKGLDRKKGKDWFRRKRYKFFHWNSSTFDKGIQHSEGVSWVGECKTHSFKTTKPLTPDEYISKYSVDTSRWELSKFICKQWDMGFKNQASQGEKLELYSVTAELKPKKQESNAKDFLDSVLEKIKSHSPSWSTQIQYQQEGKQMLEVCIFDAHFGKLALQDDCGDDYNLEIAKQRFRDCIINLTSGIKWSSIDHILFPVGNDLMNCDGLSGATTAGTPQSNDKRYHQAYTAVFESLVWAIEYMLTLAPVKMICVPGNHDTLSAWTISHAVSAWFHAAPGFSCDIQPVLRKYHDFGKVSLGFTHGDKENQQSLAMLMATERREQWAKAKYCEWHTGHLHKTGSKQWVPTSDESFGVTVRTIPSISGTDVWHNQKGYIGNLKRSEAYLWDADKGLVQVKIYNA